jgi:acyl carrier protein
MSEFYEGIAEILEVDTEAINSSFNLHSGEAPWDSLAVVSVIALIDEVFNILVDGQALANCATVADIEMLVESTKKN